MRVCCISDLHGQLPPDVPECDLLLIAGDICPDDEILASFYLQEELAPWLERHQGGEIIAIAGNHDLGAFRSPELMRALPWTYLEDECVRVGGMLLAGLPWTPLTSPGWPFTAPEAQLELLWARIPAATEILLVHGPPRGFLDRTLSGERIGSPSLLARITELRQLKLVCCGHVHEAYGRATLPGGAMIVNASLLDEGYRLVNQPIVLDL